MILNRENKMTSISEYWKSSEFYQSLATVPASRKIKNRFKPQIQFLNKHFHSNIRYGDGLFREHLKNSNGLVFLGHTARNNLQTLFMSNKVVVDLAPTSEWNLFHCGAVIDYPEKMIQFKKVINVVNIFNKMKMIEVNKKLKRPVSKVTALNLMFNSLLIKGATQSDYPVKMEIIYKKETQPYLKVFQKEVLVRDLEIFNIKLKSGILAVTFNGAELIHVDTDNSDFEQFLSDFTIDLNGDDLYMQNLDALIDMTYI